MEEQATNCNLCDLPSSGTLAYCPICTGSKSYPVEQKARWRGVTCPTCGAVAGEKCYLLGSQEKKAWLSKPHRARLRLVDPTNKALRPFGLEAF